MSAVSTALMTAEEFFEWANRPENDDRAYELDRGKVIERQYPGTARHGAVCGLANYVFGDYLQNRRRQGYAVSNNCGLVIERNPDSVFTPDLMVYTANPTTPIGNWFAVRPPQLIIEVMDENDTTGWMLSKAERYFSAGVPLVWLVCSVYQYVAPLSPGGRYAEHTGQIVLSGYDFLPDFRCKVSDLFTLPGQQQPPSPPTA